MSGKAPPDKKGEEAYIEDYDSETGEVDPATRKSAKSHRPANSASKRANKSPEIHQRSRPSRHAAGDSEHTHGTDSKSKEPKKSAEPLLKDEAQSGPRSKRRPSAPTLSAQDIRSQSPERPPRNEGRRSSPEKRPKNRPDRSGPCDCKECHRAARNERPGPIPLQHGPHPYTYPYPPHMQGPPALHQEHYPGGFMPPQPRRPRTGSFVGGRPVSFHPGIPPAYHVPRSSGAYFDNPPGVPVAGSHMYNTRVVPTHPGHPAMPVMPAMPAPHRGQPSPVKPPTRPALRQQTESYSTRLSNPDYVPKISTYDIPSGRSFNDDEEHISARELPSKSPRIPGGYDSLSESEESSPEHPPMVPFPPRPRPPLIRNSTTSQVHPTFSGRDRSRSAAIEYPDRIDHYLRDPSADQYEYDRRSDQQYGTSWDRYSDRDPLDYDRSQRPLSHRRDSISSGQTHATSYSNPEYKTLESRSGRRTVYVPQEPRRTFQQQRQREDDINEYQDQTRGYTQAEMEAGTMRATGGRPPSDLSRRSHRSRHSVSETSSRYAKTATTDGGFKITMPMGAGGESGIEFTGDMTDRQISVRPSANAGQVDVVVSGPGRETRYHKSTSSTSRSAVPTRMSSGSTRHATHSRDESRDQDRERKGSRRPSRAHS